MSLLPLFHYLAKIFFLILGVLEICYKFTVGFKNLSWGLHSFDIIIKTIESLINYILLMKAVLLLHLTEYWRLMSKSCLKIQKKKKLAGIVNLELKMKF